MSRGIMNNSPVPINWVYHPLYRCKICGTIFNSEKTLTSGDDALEVIKGFQSGEPHHMYPSRSYPIAEHIGTNHIGIADFLGFVMLSENQRLTPEVLKEFLWVE